MPCSKERGVSLDQALLTVTIDTEADNQWDRLETLSFRNTRNLGQLQKLFDELGIRATYLTTYEVASDPESAAFLRELAASGRAELGAHLHPWSNPPYARLVEDEYRHHPYPHDYPIEVFRAKMEMLGEILRASIGVQPRSYRAGRWGFVLEHAAVLRDLGYLVDTSVTPGVSWEAYSGAPGGRGGLSFLGAPRVPHRIGESRLLEVPVSIEWSRDLPSKVTSAVERLPARGWIARALRHGHILRPVWLRPYPRFDERELVRLVDRVHAAHRPVWNVMFHSSEAVAGTSSYSRDARSLEGFYRKLRGILERALELGARPATLSEAAQTLEAAGY